MFFWVTIALSLTEFRPEVFCAVCFHQLLRILSIPSNQSCPISRVVFLKLGLAADENILSFKVQ